MKTSPQYAAPCAGALFVVRLLKTLATILGFPVCEPIPVRASPIRTFPTACGVVIGAFLIVGPGASGWAQEVRLKDDTKIHADVLQTDDDSVILRVGRDRIATIDGQPLPPVLIAGMAAPAFSVTDRLNQPQAVGKETGKVTVLHFWVSWCPHCRSDAPKLQALHEQFRQVPGVQFLTVNLDQDRNALEAFIKERQPAYPVVVASDQAAHGTDLPGLYQVKSFPVTYLIDAQGIIQQKLTGSFVESGLDLEAKVAGLLPPTKTVASSSSTDAGMQLAKASCGCGCAMKGHCCSGKPGSCAGAVTP